MSSAQTITKTVNQPALKRKPLYLAKLYEHLSVHGDALDVQRLVGDLDAAPAADDHRVELAGGAYLQKRRRKIKNEIIKYQNESRKEFKKNLERSIIPERHL